MDVTKVLERGFRDAPFIAHLGAELTGLGPGWCEARLAIQPWHLQQTSVVHAGVLAALADHCAGAAASTQLAHGEFVVTAEFKINLLRGARGERLTCRAEVLKRGQALSVVEAVVQAEHGERRELVAKLNATLAVMRAQPDRHPPPAMPAG
ncbi:MAG TPA: PaaI family thioesterase [Steroidobacteraceae bacterium]|nr:PaaI family thioesterase [Steroidobacteraceae bacterium]